MWESICPLRCDFCALEMHRASRPGRGKPVLIFILACSLAFHATVCSSTTNQNEASVWWTRSYRGFVVSQRVVADNIWTEPLMNQVLQVLLRMCASRVNYNPPTYDIIFSPYQTGPFCLHSHSSTTRDWFQLFTCSISISTLSCCTPSLSLSSLLTPVRTHSCSLQLTGFYVQNFAASGIWNCSK